MPELARSHAPARECRPRRSASCQAGPVGILGVRPWACRGQTKLGMPGPGIMLFDRANANHFLTGIHFSHSGPRSRRAR